MRVVRVSSSQECARRQSTSKGEPATLKCRLLTVSRSGRTRRRLLAAPSGAGAHQQSANGSHHERLRTSASRLTELRRMSAGPSSDHHDLVDAPGESSDAVLSHSTFHLPDGFHCNPDIVDPILFNAHHFTSPGQDASFIPFTPSLPSTSYSFDNDYSPEFPPSTPQWHGTSTSFSNVVHNLHFPISEPAPYYTPSSSRTNPFTVPQLQSPPHPVLPPSSSPVFSIPPGSDLRSEPAASPSDEPSQKPSSSFRKPQVSEARFRTDRKTGKKEVLCTLCGKWKKTGSTTETVIQLWQHMGSTNCTKDARSDPQRAELELARLAREPLMDITPVITNNRNTAAASSTVPRPRLPECETIFEICTPADLATADTDSYVLT